MAIISKFQEIPIQSRYIATHLSPVRALAEGALRAPGMAYGNNCEEGLGVRYFVRHDYSLHEVARGTIDGQATDSQEIV
eukprot:3055195-Prymnesium_polylepis.1